MVRSSFKKGKEYDEVKRCMYYLIMHTQLFSGTKWSVLQAEDNKAFYQIIVMLSFNIEDFIPINRYNICVFLLPFCHILKSLYYIAAGSLHFTFWISLSLRLSLSPKFGLRPKISQKVKSFFSSGLSDSLSAIAETKLRTEQSLNPKLINSSVDYTCTR